ncbi:hypothetical protein DE146DRAFT_756091 [Phaeosphaeria sp. MPI-PUGE-AT-0046c]|nr:hypothetical protein DE146DRAFT_756091 [Phaeosphaeria sp. MPI-PUGE-AT-0046c]
MSTHEPLIQLDSGFDSATHNSTSTQSLGGVQEYLQGYQNSLSSDNNGNGSLASFDPDPQPSKRARYYSHALSPEDKAALSRGELYPNLHMYEQKDMIKYHEFRRSLVPRDVGSSKLRKVEAFANIDEEKQHSQRALDNSEIVGGRLSHVLLTNEEGENDHGAYLLQIAQSMYDLRLSSTPAQYHPSPAPPLPPVPTLRRKYSWEGFQATASPGHNIRTAGGTDYFSYVPGVEVPSDSTSRTSNCIPSPLSIADTAHQHNPNITFDTFLVPHKSGKGEAYHGALNAERHNAKDDISLSATGPAKKALRRFTKMRSTPTLRQRFSRSDLKQEGGKEVPAAPAWCSPYEQVRYLDASFPIERS